MCFFFFFFSSRRRHTRLVSDWSSDVCSSDLRPGTGACSLASAMQMWVWTLRHLQKAADADGGRLYQSSRQGVTFPLADALCWLLASRCQINDLLQLEEKGPQNPAMAEALPGLISFLTDLAH